MLQIGCALQQLSVLYEEEKTFLTFRSRLLLNKMHLGVESSASTEWLNVEAGIQEIQLNAGMLCEAIETVVASVPETSFTCRLENRNDRMRLQSKAKVGSHSVAVDDDLVLEIMTAVQTRRGFDSDLVQRCMTSLQAVEEYAEVLGFLTKVLRPLLHLYDNISSW